MTPESPGEVETAPGRFEFTAVWNVLNPSRVALALTFSRDTDGAKQAAVWTRRENSKLGRGAVKAPVVQSARSTRCGLRHPGSRHKGRVRLHSPAGLSGARSASRRIYTRRMDRTGS